MANHYLIEYQYDDIYRDQQFYFTIDVPLIDKISHLTWSMKELIPVVDNN